MKVRKSEMEINKIFRSERKKRDLTIEDLAYTSEVSRSTIARFESGNLGMSVAHLVRLLDKMDLNLCVMEKEKSNEET